MTASMTQADKALAFGALHRPGAPLVLYNIWDAGGAKALEAVGAPAVATGSASVAGAQGYPDGQAIPLDLLLGIAQRITATVNVPVSIDAEGGYAVEPDQLAANAARLIATGVVGMNFEDQVVGGDGLHPVELQSRRIAALAAAGSAAGVPFFVNARTDLFLKSPADLHATLLSQAIARAQAYASAGASGFFVPGLVDLALIRAVVEVVSLPVNIMMSPAAPPAAVLAGLGVARLSHGPFPWRAQMAALVQGYRAATADLA